MTTVDAGLPAAGPAGPAPTIIGVPNEPRAQIVLRSAEFRRGREESWRELEDLVARVEKRGINGVSADELQKMPLLYRSALSSLSVARSIALDRNLLRYLEALTLRAYLVVYGPRTSLLAGLGHFFRYGFPDAVRRAGWHILIAFAAMALGIAAGFVLVNSEAEWFNAIVPDGLAGGRGPSASAEYLRSVLFAPWDGFKNSFIVFANYLFQNNSMVAILSFGVGFMAGVPTLLLLVYNGLIVGAFLAIHYQRGLLIDCIGWLSIHGVTELGAFILCGAAGLVVAEKIIFPGRYSRLEALAIHGRQAAIIACGAVAMLFIAGFIEGGLRQLINVTSWRFAFAAVTAVLWGVYFLYCGKASFDLAGSSRSAKTRRQKPLEQEGVQP
ncbi:stage II sporulation protein M [Labrys sp. KNU-23]|uniref:stage II sporulation protein M n=1 Tax=Labrys sp. KNU-23 TaxID=2789216 RepID=UPI0011EC7493|nr:stage II sporulation protein M [Labrys sp. KNU-23]QEN86773.1 stage II sporulation protein M [Labrys sp. KNU-23]